MSSNLAISCTDDRGSERIINGRVKKSADEQSYGVSDVNENPFYVFCILI